MTRSQPRGRPSRPILTFLGGAGTVTGSRFLVETPESTVLVDCGLFQGLKELRLRNWDAFPHDPAMIDAIVLTHAHIDHLGYLPRLVKDGFVGPVYCTGSTRDLAQIVLPDSGHLQEEEAAFANKMGYSKHHPALPLYTEEEARAVLSQLRPSGFGERLVLGGDVAATLQPAGHILGSATVRLELGSGRAGARSIVFSGDLGRRHHPLLVPPAPPDGADVVVMESTYGGRTHDDTDAVAQMAGAINRTVERGGVVLIPAFAVDRTEVVLYRLRELMSAGRVPRLPVYVDSPMATKALGVYREAIFQGAPDVRPELRGGPDPFDTGHLHETRDVEESKALAELRGPAIIVSASGMATGGRVLHHLARLLPDAVNSVLLVGFQAEGTRGRLLVDGATEVKMFGRYVRVRAEVVNLRSFSVHADHDELMRWLGSAGREPDTTFLVHGEDAGAQALHTAIEQELGWSAVVAKQGERVRVDVE